MKTIINCRTETEYKQLCEYFDTQPKYMWAGGYRKFSDIKPIPHISISNNISFHLNKVTLEIMYGRIVFGAGMSVDEFLIQSGFITLIHPDYIKDFKKMFRLNSIPLELSEKCIAIMQEKNVYNKWVSNLPQST